MFANLYVLQINYVYFNIYSFIIAINSPWSCARKSTLTTVTGMFPAMKWIILCYELGSKLIIRLSQWSRRCSDFNPLFNCTIFFILFLTFICTFFMRQAPHSFHVSARRGCLDEANQRPKAKWPGPGQDNRSDYCCSVWRGTDSHDITRDLCFSLFATALYTGNTWFVKSSVALFLMTRTGVHTKTC